MPAPYLSQCGEGIDPPYDALSDLVRKIRHTRLGVYDVADVLRSWKV
nr:hypothetical protein [Streptomyces adustus]